jgi:hypothetical protein
MSQFPKTAICAQNGVMDRNTLFKYEVVSPRVLDSRTRHAAQHTTTENTTHQLKHREDLYFEQHKQQQKTAVSLPKI